MKIPDFLLKMSEELHSQNNLFTADPIFVVQEKRWDYVNDDWCDPEQYHIFTCDYEYCIRVDCTKDNWEEKLDEAIKEQGGYDAIILPVISNWEHKKFFFTRKGAENYIKINGHNHSEELRIYVDSMRRCHEMVELRKWIISLENKKLTTKKPCIRCGSSNSVIDNICEWCQHVQPEEKENEQ